MNFSPSSILMQISTILFHSYVSVYIFKYTYISVYIFQYVSIKEFLTKICNHKTISILATKSATFNHFLFLFIYFFTQVSSFIKIFYKHIYSLLKTETAHQKILLLFNTLIMLWSNQPMLSLHSFPS